MTRRPGQPGLLVLRCHVTAQPSDCGDPPSRIGCDRFRGRGRAAAPESVERGARRMRRTHGVALAALSAAIAVAVAVPAIGANGNHKGLSKHDRALLAEAKAEGKTSVIVLVAAKGGAANDAI